jgi:hypothetical protein
MSEPVETAELLAFTRTVEAKSLSRRERCALPELVRFAGRLGATIATR